MKKVRIAQIGISHEHAAGKMQTLLKMQDVFEIAGIVDDRAAIHTPIFHPADPDKFPGAHEFPFLTMEQVLADPTIEAVTIEVPNNEVVPTAMKCMERGLAMHMDKPAGEDLALYKKLLDGCEAKNLPFQVGYMFRNNPAMLFILKAARAGWLGEITEFQASMCHDYGGPDYQRYLSGFTGGIMYNLGCHIIDFIVAAMGRPLNVTPFLRSAPGYPDSILSFSNACMILLNHSILSMSVSLRIVSIRFRSINSATACASPTVSSNLSVFLFIPTPVLHRIVNSNYLQNQVYFRIRM